MSRALAGVRILDFTHVQSGPTCTQLLAWLGADVIKVERPGQGDATRAQLRDIPGVDSLYFTMLNHNKRSVTIDTKSPQGLAVLDRLIATCDVLVENFAPGALERMGITWEHIQAINPRMIVASVKGFGPGPYENLKVYENVAQCAGGAASTTGFDDGPQPLTDATTMRGFSSWMRSHENPMRSSACGAKFSTSTSQVLIKSSSTTLPLGFLVSMVIDRLLWFSIVK